jgi:hypothetical protein
MRTDDHSRETRPHAGQSAFAAGWLAHFRERARFKIDSQPIPTTRNIAFHLASYTKCITMSSSPLQTYFADLLQEKEATEVVFIEDHHSSTRITKHQFPVISQYEHEEQHKQPFEKRGDKRLSRRAWPLYTQDNVIRSIKEKSIAAKTA